MFPVSAALAFNAIAEDQVTWFALPEKNTEM
jgi:hypothetical protein